MTGEQQAIYDSILRRAGELYEDHIASNPNPVGNWKGGILSRQVKALLQAIIEAPTLGEYVPRDQRQPVGLCPMCGQAVFDE